MTLIHQIVWDKADHWIIKYESQWQTFILRSNVWSYWHIIPKYDVHTPNSFQDNAKSLDHECRSQWPTFMLRSNVRSYWFIIPNNDVYTSNSLKDTRQNHWTMKCRSQWPPFILRSNVASYWFIIPKYNVHTSNRLQDIRQNHWTVKSHADLHFMTHKSMSQDWAMSDQLFA